MSISHTPPENTASALRAILSCPTVKGDIRAALNSIDASSGRDVVRALLWQDVEVMLGLLGAVPQIANLAINALDELAKEAGSKFTPELLSGFIDSIIREIDTATLKKAIAGMKPIMDALSPALLNMWREIQEGKP